MKALKNFLEFQYETIMLLDEKKDIRMIKDRISGRILVMRRVLSSMAMLYRELQAISHRNLANVYEVHEIEGACIVIEEYVNGITMEELLRREGKVSREDAVRYMRELCAALEQLHGRNLVHRDVNARNIRVTPNGVLKLMDFDAVRMVKGGQNHDTTMLGTVGYAAPEQFGFFESDSRTDVYAAGVLLNHMLTGRLPGEELYRGDKRLEYIIAKCMRMDKDKRFGQAGEIVRELDRTRSGYYAHKFYSYLPGIGASRWYHKVAVYCGYFVLLYTFFYQESEYLEILPRTPGYVLLGLLSTTLLLVLPAAVLANAGHMDVRLFAPGRYSRSTRIVFRCILAFFFYCLGSILDTYLS